KPVLIATAVAGATTMIFSIILLLQEHLHAGAVAAAGGGLVPENIGETLLHDTLSLTASPVLLGFLCGGAVIYWFCGASIQAVTTGAYSAVEFIKKNLNLNMKEAKREDSITVVRIC